MRAFSWARFPGNRGGPNGSAAAVPFEVGRHLVQLAAVGIELWVNVERLRP